MREILFRGKRVDNDEWVEGGFYREPNDDIKSGVSYIIGGSLYDVGSAYAVIPETVGQYTGLTDKNGKRIFEGAILQCDNIKGTVKYSDKQAAFTFMWKRFNLYGGDSFKKCVLADFGKFYDIKLIGNIHDNPELLKGGEINE